jgi:hypothetical protein
MSILLSWQWRTSINSTLLTTSLCHLLSTILKYATSLWHLFHFQTPDHWYWLRRVDNTNAAIGPQFHFISHFSHTKTKTNLSQQLQFFSHVCPSIFHLPLICSCYWALLFFCLSLQSSCLLHWGSQRYWWCIFSLNNDAPSQPLFPPEGLGLESWTDWRCLFVLDCSPDVSYQPWLALPPRQFGPERISRPRWPGIFLF